MLWMVTLRRRFDAIVGHVHYEVIFAVKIIWPKRGLLLRIKIQFGYVTF